MSKLTHLEEVTARALESVRNGTAPEVPPRLRAMFDDIARNNPDLVAQTRAIIRRTIEKTTN